MTQYRINDSGDLRKYRTEIPNIVDEMDLDPYAFRLYVHLKRVAGDSGACWQSTETLAKACKMSMSTISEAKKTLKDAGLIEIEEVENEHGGRKFHNIKIIDIWARNMEAFRTSHSELKNKPIKKEPIKNPLSLAHIDFENLSIQDYDRIPELKLFREATSYIPPSGARGVLLKLIVSTIRKEQLAALDIETAFTHWTAGGYRSDNIEGWLCDWAPKVKKGERPWEHKSTSPKSNVSQPRSLIDAAREYQAKKAAELAAEENSNV